MGFADLGVIEQSQQMRGGGDLAGMRTGELNALVESGGRAHQGFERHGAGEVGQPDDALGAGDGKRPHSDHGLGAVEQSQAFFGGELERLETGAVQGFGARTCAGP